MDAFESIVAAILESKGFWVRRSVRVTLVGDHKRKKSAPRTELDIVAFCPQTDELWVVECKSFLDSRGVKAAAFLEKGHRGAKRYKVFLEEKYWESVKCALLSELDFTPERSPSVRLCLVAGKIAGRDLKQLEEHFQKKGWELRDPNWLRAGIQILAKRGYENDVATMTAKLLINNAIELNAE